MKNLIQAEGKLSQGDIMNKYFNSRLFRKNQNVILAVTGGTGSGKSYYCLSMMNNWYQHQFKKDFPIENVCFSIGDIMKLLHSKKLKKGEMIIMEEGGVQMNSLDFQNKISKLFTFVLQSFRSMNIGLIINLPVLTMLNKSARLLLHAHFTTAGIDYKKKSAKCKPHFHQLNQTTGKSYWKFLQIKHNRLVTKVKKLSYSMPPEHLVESYELKKLKFVSELNENFVREIEAQRTKEDLKMARTNLTEIQMEVYNHIIDGKTIKEIAEIRGVSRVSTQDTIRLIKKKGYKLKITKFPKEK